MTRKGFVTPERFAKDQAKRMVPSRGRLLIASCQSGSGLADSVAGRYRQLLRENGSSHRILQLAGVDRRFSDGETSVQLDFHVDGYDVFLFQSLQDPGTEALVDQNYVAFLIASRAFRENGAKHVTAVLPYLAYSRQDKPTRFTREPTTAKLMADLSMAAGIDRLVTWHPHSRQIQGFYHVPVDLPAVLSLFTSEYNHFRGRDDVIAVAPDAGAAKLVAYFGRALDLKSAIASKFRPEPELVTISEVIGDFADKRVAIILDDMVSSGGTVYAIVKKLVDEVGIEEVCLGVSHNLCSEQARRRLEELNKQYHLKEMIVTDSIPQAEAFRALPFVSVRSLDDTLARVINRIHYGEPVSGLFRQPSAGSKGEKTSNG
jgi:ribose-phosphate pyrophosphokinase